MGILNDIFGVKPIKSKPKKRKIIKSLSKTEEEGELVCELKYGNIYLMNGIEMYVHGKYKADNKKVNYQINDKVDDTNYFEGCYHFFEDLRDKISFDEYNKLTDGEDFTNEYPHPNPPNTLRGIRYTVMLEYERIKPIIDKNGEDDKFYTKKQTLTIAKSLMTLYNLNIISKEKEQMDYQRAKGQLELMAEYDEDNKAYKQIKESVN